MQLQVPSQFQLRNEVATAFFSEKSIVWGNPHAHNFELAYKYCRRGHSCVPIISPSLRGLLPNHRFAVVKFKSRENGLSFFPQIFWHKQNKHCGGNGRGKGGSVQKTKRTEGCCENEGREIRTPNLLIWSQTRCRCAMPPLSHETAPL